MTDGDHKQSGNRRHEETRGHRPTKRREKKTEAPSVRGMSDADLETEKADLQRRWDPNVPSIAHRINVIDGEFARRAKERKQEARDVPQKKDTHVEQPAEPASAGTTVSPDVIVMPSGPGKAESAPKPQEHKKPPAKDETPARVLPLAKEKAADISGQPSGAAASEDERKKEKTVAKTPAATKAETAAAEAPKQEVAAAQAAKKKHEAGPDKTETVKELLDAALKNATFFDRLRLRHERTVLERAQQSLDRRQSLPADMEPVWWALSKIARQAVDDGLSQPEDIERLTKSYAELLQLNGLLDAPEDDARVLSIISEQRSPEEALRLFSFIQQRHRAVIELIQTKGGKDREYPLLDHIADAWVEDLRQTVREAEQRGDRRRDIDPEYLGRLQSVIDQPTLPETLPEQVRAATTYIHLLRGDSPVPDFVEGREPTSGGMAARERVVGMLRGDYAEALAGQSRWLGRVSEVELEERRTAYQTTIEAYVAAGVNEIAEKLRSSGAVERIDPQQEAQTQAAIVDLVLQMRWGEEEALHKQLQTDRERLAGTTMKRFWKHRATRTTVAALLTGALTAGTTNNIVATGIMAAVTPAAARLWEKAEATFGETRKISRPEARALTDEELERKVVAHVVASTALPENAYEKELGRGATVKELLTEYLRRKSAVLSREVLGMREKGLTHDQIIEGIALHSMTDEIALHRSYEDRLTLERRTRLRKWLVATGSGMIVGALTGGPGVGRFVRSVKA